MRTFCGTLASASVAPGLEASSIEREMVYAAEYANEPDSRRSAFTVSP